MGEIIMAIKFIIFVVVVLVCIWIYSNLEDY